MDFLSSNEWPAGSLELNALDYYAWSRMEQLLNIEMTLKLNLTTAKLFLADFDAVKKFGDSKNLSKLSVQENQSFTRYVPKTFR